MVFSDYNADQVEDTDNQMSLDTTGIINHGGYDSNPFNVSILP
jgi:hypothetical protein